MTRRGLLATSRDQVGLVALVLVAVATVVAQPETTNRVVTATLMVVATAGVLLDRRLRRPWGLVANLTATAAGLVVLVVAPGGLGEVPVLVAAATLPALVAAPGPRRALVLVVAALFGAGVAWISRSPTGLLAGIGIWLLAQRTLTTEALQVERDRAVALLAEVQAGRDAQADAAAAGERARIAREMHDVLAHSLAGLSLQLQAVRAVAEREGAGQALTDPLDRAAALAREGVTEARAVVASLDRVGPRRGVGDLVGLVDRFPGRAALAVSGPVGELVPDASHALYRAVQESLTNAARYAPGAPVAVALDWGPHQLVATVSNEAPPRAAGSASTPASSAASSLVSTPASSAASSPVAAGASDEAGRSAATGRGLAGMAERLTAVGGRAAAGPVDGGWLVRLLVPVAAGSSGAADPAVGPAAPAPAARAGATSRVVAP